MSDPDILYIAKPYKLDLVDLLSGAIRTQKWTNVPQRGNVKALNWSAH